MPKRPRISTLKVAFCCLLDLLNLFLERARNFLKHLWITKGALKHAMIQSGAKADCRAGVVVLGVPNGASCFEFEAVHGFPVVPGLYLGEVFFPNLLEDLSKASRWAWQRVGATPASKNWVRIWALSGKKVSVTEPLAICFSRELKKCVSSIPLAATWPQNVGVLGAYFLMRSHLHVGSLRVAHCFDAS